jgi:hypothetical protein
MKMPAYVVAHGRLTDWRWTDLGSPLMACCTHYYKPQQCVQFCLYFISSDLFYIFKGALLQNL